MKNTKLNNIRRSKWKFSFFSPKLIKSALMYTYVVVKKTGKPSRYWKKPYLTYRSKNFCIPRFLRNSIIWIHQGKSLVRRQVYPFMLGHKIGEFCLTRKPFFFPPKKKKR